MGDTTTFIMLTLAVWEQDQWYCQARGQTATWTSCKLRVADGQTCRKQRETLNKMESQWRVVSAEGDIIIAVIYGPSSSSVSLFISPSFRHFTCLSSLGPVPWKNIMFSHMFSFKIEQLVWSLRDVRLEPSDQTLCEEFRCKQNARSAVFDVRGNVLATPRQSGVAPAGRRFLRCLWTAVLIISRIMGYSVSVMH